MHDLEYPEYLKHSWKQDRYALILVKLEVLRHEIKMNYIAHFSLADRMFK